MSMVGINARVTVLIDYLTMTFKNDDYIRFIHLFSLDDCELVAINSFLGYEHCFYYEGVRIHWNVRQNQEVCVDCSGKGIRTIETLNKDFDWFEFFSSYKLDMQNKNVHVSRLDVAGDEFANILDFDTISQYTQKKKYVSKAKSEPWGTWGRKREIYFGSEKSDRILRIYDKALEQKIACDHWLRCEMQLRNDNAYSFIMNWIDYNSIGKTYCGVLVDYIRFVTKVNDGSVKSVNLHTVSWWRAFTSDISAISQVYLMDNEYTLERVMKYVRKNCSSSLRTVMLASKGDVTEILKIIDDAKINRKQEVVLSQLGDKKNEKKL